MILFLGWRGKASIFAKISFAWSMTNSLCVLLSILKLKYHPRYLNSSSILMGGISSFLMQSFVSTCFKDNISFFTENE